MKFTELIIAVAGILFIFNQLKNLCKHEEDEKESSDDDDVDISTTSEKFDEDVDESTTSEKSDCEESEEEEEEMNVSSIDSEVEEAEEESFEKGPEKTVIQESSLKKETSATSSEKPTTSPRVVPESKIPTVPKSITKPSYEIIQSPTEKAFVILRGNNSERLIMHPKVEEIMKLKNKEEQIKKLLDLEKEMDKEMKATITIPSFDIPDRVRPYRGIFPSMF